MSRRISSPRHACALATLAAFGIAGCGDDERANPRDPEPDPDMDMDVRAPEVAQTSDGPVRASDSQGMRNYFGIPLAAPPIGALRWAPPAAPATWTTPLAKTRSEAPCLQTSASPFALLGDKEDCLYLDVHAPTGIGPFPVMVWFHGGAFNTGGTVTFADPSPLVDRGVIVVNVAYRLGPLGFLGHPALKVDGSVGNYGIMDQQAALRWVRKNIAAFGGNAANVTIFGESAGGFSVMTHLASPLSAGLFDKAIVQSGAYAFDRQLPQATLETLSTTVITNALAAAGITCPTVDAACLRQIPDTAIKQHVSPAFNAIPALSSPVPSIDGKVLPQSIKATFAAGTNNKVPLLNGSNKDEWSLFIAISELTRRRAATPPDLDPESTTHALAAAAYVGALAGVAGASGRTGADLAAAYPLTDYGSVPAIQPSLGATAAGTDGVFACAALNLSKRVAAQGSPSFMYEFRDATTLPLIGLTEDGYMLSFSQGAGHSYELQYLFDLRDLASAERTALSAAMTAYWTNFAQSGDPNRGAGVPAAWAEIGGSNSVLGLDVAAAGGIKPLAISFDTAHKCSTVWSELRF